MLRNAASWRELGLIATSLDRADVSSLWSARRD